MSKLKVRVGTRRSALAQAQARWVIDKLHERFPHVEARMIFVPTVADLDRESRFHQFGISGVFTHEHEIYLMENKVDFVVHSLKDLPTVLMDGLVLACVPARADPRDALCGTTLASLSPGARIGTGSLRRRAQLLALRSDIEVVPIRGNLPPRLRKLRGTDRLDAVVLAVCGLERINLAQEIGEILHPEIFPYAVGQGALGLEARADNFEMLEMLHCLEDGKSRAEVNAERSLLHSLGAGCSLPVGVTAETSGETLSLFAQITSLDGTKKITTAGSGPSNQSEAIGRLIAQSLKELGGATLLDEAYRLFCAHARTPQAEVKTRFETSEV